MARQFLTQDLELHINPSAKPDVTNGADGIFPTMQHAYNWLQNSVDLQGFKVKFILSAGDHLLGLNPAAGLTGGYRLHIVGSGGTRIVPPGGGCIANGIAGLEITAWNVTFGGAAGCVALYGGRIVLANGDDVTQHTNITFEQLTAANDHLQASYMGVIDVRNNYAVSGGCSTHIHAFSRGIITMQTSVGNAIGVTLTNTPTFDRWIGVADAAVVARNLWVEGTAHCETYLVHKLGYADLASAHLPGTGQRIQTGGIVT